MDQKTRGAIEKMIDDNMKLNVLQDIEWVRDIVPLTSFEDVVFGYVIGVLKASIYVAIIPAFGNRLIPEKDKWEVDKILERRVPEIRQKILRELGR